MAKMTKTKAEAKMPPLHEVTSEDLKKMSREDQLNCLARMKRDLRLTSELEQNVRESQRHGEKLIRPFDLRELGYRLAGRRERLLFGLSLMQVVDADTGKPASFCYLHSEFHGRGHVITRSFDSVMQACESQ